MSQEWMDAAKATLEAVSSEPVPVLEAPISQKSPHLLTGDHMLAMNPASYETYNAYWGWVIAGRMACAAFEVSPQMDNATIAAIARQAREDLIDYVRRRCAPGKHGHVGIVEENEPLPIPRPTA